MSWQAKTRDIKDKLEHLKIFKEMSDITIVIGEKLFQTHTWLLSMYSERFYDMFNGPKAKRFCEIPLSDVNADIFELFLDYIYSDIMTINTSEQALSLLMFADEYKVAQIRTGCVNFLAQSLPSNIITEIFEASSSSQASRNEPRSGNESCSSNDRSSKILKREESLSFVDASDDSLEMPIEESREAIENLFESFPHSNHPSAYPVTENSFYARRNRRQKRIIDFSNLIKEDCTENKKFENLLEFVSASDWDSEVKLKEVLLNWGRGQYRQHEKHISWDLIEKLYQLLQEELKELKEKRFQEFQTGPEPQNRTRLPTFPSKCKKNWVSSLNFPYIKEKFRSNELDLYVYGVYLFLKCSSKANRTNLSIITNLKISNVTEKIHESKEISVSPDGSDRAIPLKLLNPIYIKKGEICEIIVSSESKIKNGEFIYCGGMCCLDHRLEKLPTESALGGHFNSIIAGSF